MTRIAALMTCAPLTANDPFLLVGVRAAEGGLVASELNPGLAPLGRAEHGFELRLVGTVEQGEHRLAAARSARL
jgi:hypothetical protein